MRSIVLSLVAVVALIACGGDDGGSTMFEGPRPGKRSDISGVIDPNTGNLVVFGGDNGPIVNQIPSAAYVDDTWILDPDSGWTQVSASGPSARGRYATALDPSDSQMFLFGGRFRTAGAGGDYTLYNDLWAFDFAAQTWAEVDSGAGAAPTARIFATSAYDPGAATLYLYGGSTSPSGLTLTPSDEVWSFANGAWTLESPTGAAPSTRVFQAFTYDSQRNRLVVFGGQLGDFQTAAFNDLYALDLGTMTWSQLHAGGSGGPSGRFLAMMTYDSDRDRYLVMGGHADPGVANDVWAFDPNSNNWALFTSGDSFTGGALGCLGNTREIPTGYVDEDLDAPERRQGAIFEYHDGKVWLFGGESDCSDHLDDVWAFDADDGSWTKRLEARSGESCARRAAACECLCL